MIRQPGERILTLHAGEVAPRTWKQGDGLPWRRPYRPPTVFVPFEAVITPRQKMPRPEIMLLAGVGWIITDQPRTSIFHWAAFESKAQAYRAWILWQRMAK